MFRIRSTGGIDNVSHCHGMNRIESLRQADLSKATSPRIFGDVLLARFDVRVNPSELQELIMLLQDKVPRRLMKVFDDDSS